MDDQTVQPNELTGYRATAAELHRIADILATLPGDDAPYVTLSILPRTKSAEAVDVVTLAVLGKRGTTRRDSDGWRHIAESRGYTELVRVSIHALVPGPADERDVELARLRAEVEQLRTAQEKRAADRGFEYSREQGPEDGELTQPGRIEPQNGGMTDGGLVDETDPLIGDLREIVHWRTGDLLDLRIACGAESGPFTSRRTEVTCPACLAASGS